MTLKTFDKLSQRCYNCEKVDSTLIWQINKERMLEYEDIIACLQFASRKINHPVIAA